METKMKKVEYGCKKITENKNICLMCPECYDLVGSIRQKLDIDFYTDNNGHEKFYSHTIHFQIEGYCDNCDRYIEEFIEIDADIAPTISLLNQKGWKTLYCCAGHEDSNDAYIYFKNNRYLKYIGILPKGWKVDIKDYTVMKDFIIRAKYNCYDKFELYEWAEKLPILPDTAKIRTIPEEELIKNLLNLSKDQLDLNEDKTQK